MKVWIPWIRNQLGYRHDLIVGAVDLNFGDFGHGIETGGVEVETGRRLLRLQKQVAAEVTPGVDRSEGTTLVLGSS